MTDPAVYRFGPFRLLAARRELLLHGVPVTLGQRATEVLLALVSRAGQLVTKDEIMAEVWPGVIVEENNLQVHVSALRKVLTSAGGAQKYLLTVAGRGYRFVAPVERETAGVTMAADLPAAQPAVSAPAGNLAAPLTRFIGRAEELAQVTARLRAGRLVTLTGAGGVGKTRLAVEAGWVLQPDFADGVWMVELAPLQDPRLVASAIAEAAGLEIGIDSGAGAVAAALRTRRLLLILDNCEHVIGDSAAVADQLLRACPQLTILATSREPLAITGETVLRVPSLKLPAASCRLTAAQALQFDALVLFADRAQAAAGDWSLDNANAEAVAAICWQLEGIPLAIEMAAPRLRAMSLQRLASSLDERLRLLANESRTALPRHRTLRAVIDWSYALLNDDEKLLLQRVSVFAGAASLDSILVVAGGSDQAQTQDLLSSLVDKSLVAVERGAGEPRYRLPAATRHYARELLGPGEPALRRRHAEHFRNRLAQAATEWERTSGPTWFQRYGADVDELRAALDFAFGATGDAILGLELVASSHELWGELGSMQEHRRWVEEALRHAASGLPEALLARLLSWHPGDVRELDDPVDTEEALRAAALHASAGDAFNEGRGLLRAGSTRLLIDADNGENLLREAHEKLHPFGPTKSLARCLSALATARLLAGDAQGARVLHAKAVATSGMIGP